MQESLHYYGENKDNPNAKDTKFYWWTWIVVPVDNAEPGDLQKQISQIARAHRVREYEAHIGRYLQAEEVSPALIIKLRTSTVNRSDLKNFILNLVSLELSQKPIHVMTNLNILQLGEVYKDAVLFFYAPYDQKYNKLYGFYDTDMHIYICPASSEQGGNWLRQYAMTQLRDDEAVREWAYVQFYIYLVT